MAHLVSGCTTFVERSSGRTSSSKSSVQDHHSVGCRGSTGELGVSQNAVAKCANPNIKFGGGGGGVDPTLGRLFHVVSRTPAGLGGGFAG